jgi:single-strand DNA-binding protein
MINNVVVSGRLTKDIELKVNNNGKEMVKFQLATNRPFKTEAGEYETDFINCVAFNQTAKYLNQYTKKGLMVSIVGAIRTGSFENKEGQKVYTTDIFVERASIPNLPKNDNNNNNSPSDFMTNNNTNDFSDDDLPF